MAIGDKLVNLDALKAVHDADAANVADLKSAIALANNGYEVIKGTFFHGSVNTTTGVMTESANNYKYQAVTPDYITYDHDVTIRCNAGYKFQAYWYDENDELAGKMGSAGTEYNIPANGRFRLFVSLDPVDTTANVDVNVFQSNVYVASTIGADIETLEKLAADAKAGIALANQGYELIDTRFAHGTVDSSTGAMTETANNYKYQAITPNAITYDRDVTIKCSAGYVFQAYWYDAQDAYSGKMGSFGTSYLMPAGRRFRLFIRLDPNDTTANVDASVFGRNVYVKSIINDDLNEIAVVDAKIDLANRGRVMIPAGFVNGRMVDNFPQNEPPYKYQAVTMDASTFDRDVLIKADTGYRFTAYWYNDNDEYVSRMGAAGTSYLMPAGRHFRLLAQLDPPDNTATVSPETFLQHIYIESELSERIGAMEGGIDTSREMVEMSNSGKALIETTFAHGRMVDNFPSVSASSYKYQAVTPNVVTYSRDVTIKANTGYQFTAYWYNDNDEYVSRMGSSGTSYLMPAGRHFRLLVQLDPADITANVDVETFKRNVYITTEVADRITNLETQPISTLPAYIKNTLSDKPLGSLSKGYILLSFDDGALTLATGTIPLLIANEVPGTFGLLPQSAIFATGNETELAAVVDAVENHGCVVAMHGSALWPTYTESALNQYFGSTVALFADKDLGDTYGAICPGGVGDDTSALVKAVAGGYFGYVFSGNRADKISYDTVSADGKYNGARSNRYDLDRRSGIGITSAKAHDIVAYAAENHLLLCPFWHDDTLNDANHTEYVTYFSDLITEAKAAGLTFITTKDLPNII